jgi:hypothetical protein
MVATFLVSDVGGGAGGGGDTWFLRGAALFGILVITDSDYIERKWKSGLSVYYIQFMLLYVRVWCKINELTWESLELTNNGSC